MATGVMKAAGCNAAAGCTKAQTGSGSGERTGRSHAAGISSTRSSTGIGSTVDGIAGSRGAWGAAAICRVLVGSIRAHTASASGTGMQS